MLDERDVRLDAEENASAERPIWRSIYNMVRCVSSTCPHGPHRWVDPMGKKHYPLKAHHIKRLITHVEKGGVLEGYKYVPETVHDELYREEQQRMDFHWDCVPIPSHQHPQRPTFPVRCPWIGYFGPQAGG